MQKKKKLLRKGTQLSLLNRKRAGRPPVNDAGIRHTSRPVISKPASLHLTIKVKRNKADIKNKAVLAILKKAILNARLKGLKVIHYSLEFDHVHLLIEADNNKILGKGMQAFGVTLAKAINKLWRLGGGVYKHRYHFRRITGSKDLRNVMNYIFKNGVKHKTAKSIINPFNSIKAEIKSSLCTNEKVEIDLRLVGVLDKCKIYYHGLEYC